MRSHSPAAAKQLTWDELEGVRLLTCRAPYGGLRATRMLEIRAGVTLYGCSCGSRWSTRPINLMFNLPSFARF